MEPITYKGGLFRDMLLQYSKDRCKRDNRYRRSVRRNQLKKRKKLVGEKPTGVVAQEITKIVAAGVEGAK